MEGLVQDLELSVRVANILGRDMTIPRFMSLTPSNFPGLGPKGWKEVKTLQQNLLGNSRADRYKALLLKLRQCTDEAHQLGLTMTVLDGRPTLIKVLSKW